MTLALGTLMLLVASFMLGGLMMLSAYGLVLLISRRLRQRHEHANRPGWQATPMAAPVEEGPVVVAPEA